MEPVQRTDQETVLNFVQIIQQYPCLYNNTLPDYARKDVVDKAWNEVAEQMRWTVQFCQSKWKNIRNGFVRSLKLCPDGLTKKRKKLYYLHNELQFLVPFIKAIIQTEEPGNNSPQDAREDEEFNSPFSELYCPIEEESVSALESISSPASVLRKTKIRKAEIDVDWLRERDYNKDDSRKMFLFSLLPDVEILSDEQMRDFRIKVLLLLEEVRTSPSRNIYNQLEQYQRQYQQYKNVIEPVQSTLSPLLKTEVADDTLNSDNINYGLNYVKK